MKPSMSVSLVSMSEILGGSSCCPSTGASDRIRSPTHPMRVETARRSTWRVLRSFFVLVLVRFPLRRVQRRLGSPGPPATSPRRPEWSVKAEGGLVSSSSTQDDHGVQLHTPTCETSSCSANSYSDREPPARNQNM